MTDPRLIDLDRRIKACIAKHGFTERDLIMVYVRQRLVSKDFVGALQALPVRFVHDFAWKLLHSKGGAA